MQVLAMVKALEASEKATDQVRVIRFIRLGFEALFWGGRGVGGWVGRYSITARMIE